MRTRSLTVAALLLGVFGMPLLAQEIEEPTPTPEVVIEKACAAAGGWAAFQSAGAYSMKVAQEEVTSDGKVQKSMSGYILSLPGPVPARFESPEAGVVAGDDGQKGWAIVRGKPDARQSTTVMVRRLVQSDLFPLLLPFSLKWEGVVVTDVKPVRVQGQRLWRLTLDFSRTFFSSPQTATRWTVDVNPHTWEIVSAVSPATDLGRGIKADGLRYGWAKPVKVGNVTLRAEERVVGIDEQGADKPHTRVRTLEIEPLTAAQAKPMLSNPIPLDQRPKPQNPNARPSLPPAK